DHLELPALAGALSRKAYGDREDRVPHARVRLGQRHQARDRNARVVREQAKGAVSRIRREDEWLRGPGLARRCAHEYTSSGSNTCYFDRIERVTRRKAGSPFITNSDAPFSRAAG